MGDVPIRNAQVEHRQAEEHRAGKRRPATCQRARTQLRSATGCADSQGIPRRPRRQRRLPFSDAVIASSAVAPAWYTRRLLARLSANKAGSSADRCHSARARPLIPLAQNDIRARLPAAWSRVSFRRPWPELPNGLLALRIIPASVRLGGRRPFSRTLRPVTFSRSIFVHPASLNCSAARRAACLNRAGMGGTFRAYTYGKRNSLKAWGYPNCPKVLDSAS